jgi:hypothetical protein
MQPPPTAAPTASAPSAPTTHVPDVVRAVMLLVGVLALAKFTVLNEHMKLGAVAWIAFVAYVGLAVAAAGRIVAADALPLREPHRQVQRTRQMGVFKELVIAGTGGLFLICPFAYLMIATSEEVWAGTARASDFSPIGLVFTSLFGLTGFFMVFWRPQFVLDAATRKIVRYAFGRSVPLRTKELPYSELSVSSEGYFITNTGQRLGDMIRGRVGKDTFELEMLHGSFAPEQVQARAMAWATSLGATYKTPEQAAAEELQR